MWIVGELATPAARRPVHGGPHHRRLNERLDGSGRIGVRRKPDFQPHIESTGQSFQDGQSGRCAASLEPRDAITPR